MRLPAIKAATMPTRGRIKIFYEKITVPLLIEALPNIMLEVGGSYRSRQRSGWHRML